MRRGPDKKGATSENAQTLGRSRRPPGATRNKFIRATTIRRAAAARGILRLDLRDVDDWDRRARLPYRKITANTRDYDQSA